MTDTRWDKDILRRSLLADRVVDLVKTHSLGAVIGIEGDFGSGKTYFLTNLHKQLKETGAACVYFNAWEADFVESPLLTLMTDIVAALSDQVPQAIPAEKMKEAARRLLPIIVRVGAKSILRAGGEELDKLLGPIDEEVEALFSDRRDRKFSRNDLAKARSALQDLISAAQNHSPESFPLIVLVDELDRANPHWVVTFLESVKHLLGHQHIVFLIAIDRTNLVALLKHEFGQGYDVDEYLRKFFNYSIGIQDSSGDHEFLTGKLRDMGLVADGILQEDDTLASGIQSAASGCLFGLGGPSGRLRRAERAGERLGVCLRAAGPKGWANLVGFLVGLETSNRKLFESYVAGLVSKEDLRAFSSLKRGAQDEWQSNWLLACSIARDDWGVRRSSIQAALSADVALAVERQLQSHEFFLVGGYHSVVDLMLERIGWLLNVSTKGA